MKTLVLNVDRDDDFGRKANVKSPIVGIEANIDAANRLGQADPEDSDLNAIFSAISTYNQLSKDGKEVEIATICGHMNVGVKSDQILTEQLENVIKVGIRCIEIQRRSDEESGRLPDACAGVVHSGVEALLDQLDQP